MDSHLKASLWLEQIEEEVIAAIDEILCDMLLSAVMVNKEKKEACLNEQNQRNQSPAKSLRLRPPILSGADQGSPRKHSAAVPA
jgi:hypothetical protein